MDYMKYITIQVIKKSERSEVVFAAMDEMDVPVVVKRLQGANPEIYRSISKLRNLHIPRIYCVEEQGEALCIAEEYIDGRTLDVYLAEETLTDLQKMELMVQLCEALEVLHQCNPPVIHRDIKPSNILITTDGVLKIIVSMRPVSIKRKRIPVIPDCSERLNMRHRSSSAMPRRMCEAIFIPPVWYLMK